jgi:hypothetical protein
LSPDVRAVGGAAGFAAALAVAVRVPLLWDDAWAPGYDGGYYVLQVRSWQDGAPIFADASWVFPLLAVLARVCGDVVVGNKVGSLIFGAFAAAAVAVAAGRARGGWAALAAGALAAASPGHLALSAEFLKNAAGVAVLAAVLAAIPDRRTVWGWVPSVAVAVLGLFVHKATGLLGVAVVGAAFAGAEVKRLGWARAFGVGLVVVGVAAVGVGVVRGVDWARLVAETGTTGRWAALWGPRVAGPQRVELLVGHALPIGLAGWMAAQRSRTEWGRLLPLWVLSVVAVAPGLPFSFDGTAWRLMLHGFLPLALVAGWGVGAVAGRWRAAASVGVVALAVATAPTSVRSHASVEPPYERFEAHVAALQAAIPPDARVVAHRGLCGWIWARAGRVCENFDPEGPEDGWWRVVYGVPARALAPHADVPPTAFAPGYTIVTEPTWRRYRATRPPGTALVFDERNPHRPRPAYVYGPGRSTPEGGR